MKPATTRVPRRGLQGWWALVTLLVTAVTCLHATPVVAAAMASSFRAAAACVRESARESYTPRGFFGYACLDDRCNSHKAGFDWAERNGIADALACTSRNDPGFVEGCRAFAEEAVTPEQAGFEWARENELDDTCHCAGAGPGFEAGCAAYVTGFAQ
jgi:hypothetical protein